MKLPIKVNDKKQSYSHYGCSGGRREGCASGQKLQSAGICKRNNRKRRNGESLYRRRAKKGKSCKMSY